jgi:hypothetical protein
MMRSPQITYNPLVKYAVSPQFTRNDAVSSGYLQSSRNDAVSPQSSRNDTVSPKSSRNESLQSPQVYNPLVTMQSHQVAFIIIWVLAAATM